MTSSVQADQPVGTTGSAVPDPPAAAKVKNRARYQRTRLVRRGLSPTGFVFAAVCFCLSFTPSLLPRGVLLQGVVAGLTAAIGYAGGATLGWLARTVSRRNLGARTRRIGWRVLVVVSPMAGLVFVALGTGWQQDLRARLDMPRLESYDLIQIVLVAVATFAVILLVARLLRLATRILARLLGRLVPKPIAYGVGFVVVVYLVVGFVEDFLVGNLITVANQAASLTDGGTTPGAHQPGLSLLSGSPASLVRWESLGRQGRDFIGTAPSSAQLSAFAGRPTLDPIRVYVGLGSAGSVDERAALAVRELERTGAFEREVLVLVTATGTGWVDENVADALEYMYAGDTALVSMQYSYLPSWLSFMVDQSKATEAASTLITAVHLKWESLPAQARPKLLLFGESLGSYGTETTYQNLQSMANGADGVLLVGPPFANPIWSQLVAERDPSSPVWSPVYRDGQLVRFAEHTPTLRTLGGERPKVLYLQNASDPIVWWSPQLLFRSPEWLQEPRGPDVSPDMRWYPGITFWQTAIDLAFATNVPTGHGHVYGSSVVDGWAALAPPPGWTTSDTERLMALLDAHPR